MNDTGERTDGFWKFTLVRAWMLAAMLIYALLALNDARPVDWSAPWSPSKKVGTGWFVFATVAAILTWADGWLLPWFSRRRPSSQTTPSRTRWEYSAFGRFLVRAAVFHGAGIWGLLLSFKAHDARYAIVSLIVSSLMILLLPRPRCTRLPNADDSDAPPRPALP
jgi:hypothetical protein